MLERFPIPSLARSCWRPAADVYRTADGWLIKIELAGVRLEDLSVEVQERRVKIAGQRRDVVLEIGGRCQSLEIAYDRFERWFDFPCDLPRQEPQVRFENGMLLVLISAC
ncbi:MAG: Hsp20/alpha crystallin family protein [Planctomycetaceae bacterium]